MNREIHITLVGGQPDPVYFVIKHLNPDEIIYICSQESKQDALLIKEIVNAPNQEILCIDPLNAHEIQKTAEVLSERYATDNVSVNISGGTKPWTFFFGEIFHNCPNAKIMFIDQNYRLWNYTDMQSADISNVFDLPTSFILHSNPLLHYTDFNSYTADDDTAMRTLENARKFSRKAFTALLNVSSFEDKEKLKNHVNGKIVSTGDTMSYVEWFFGDEERYDSVHLVLYNQGRVFEKDISSPHAISLAFNSGWFEYKVAKMISGWDKQLNIYLNCRFLSDNQIDKNEVDIIVNTARKPVFIECKTYVSKISDIDKFKSVSRNYGGIGSKAIVVSDAALRPYVKEKCKDNNLSYFSLQENTVNTQEELIEFLDEETRTINTR